LSRLLNLHTSKECAPFVRRLMDAHLPHGNAAYQDLHARMSTELTPVHGDKAGEAVSEAGAPISAMMIEMTKLAYPKLVVPEDHK
jgi:hypothetical protein